MSMFSVRVAADDADTDRAAVERVARKFNAEITWFHALTFGRLYARIEGDAPGLGSALHALQCAVVVDSELIALAVTPSTPEALPLLEDALGGPGRPSGVVGCDRVDDAVIVEWNPERTSAATILAIIDSELARLHASRHNSLISPLSLAALARVASEGLAASEIVPERILEVQLERSGALD